MSAPRPDGPDGRNVVLAVALSISILLAFDLLYAAPERAARLAQEQTAEGPAGAARTPVTAPAGSLAPAGQGAGQGAGGLNAGGDADARAAAPRARLSARETEGSLSLLGARLDDLSLPLYRASLALEAGPVALLAPEGSERPFFAEFGWAGEEGVALPGPDTLWSPAGAGALTPETPLHLVWESPSGLLFEQIWRMEGPYLFAVEQRATNRSDTPRRLAPFALVARTNPPPGLGFFILHEGPLGWTDEALQEPSYKDIAEEPIVYEQAAGGWLGFTDKYWMAALLPPPPVGAEGKVQARLLALPAGDGASPGSSPRYQADILHPAAVLAPGASMSVTDRLYAGAKEVRRLDAVAESFGAAHFDLAVDFGWLYFLTKPLFFALDWFNRLFGNFGVAILAVTVCMRIVFFPLANQSFRTMAEMRKLQPEVLELRERYGEDKQRMQQEMMRLYRERKLNPMMGCLPVLLQIPVFFALYKVLFVTIEMRHAPFWGWIRDLSAPDPTTWINLFGLLPFDRPGLGLLDFFQIGAAPLLMGLTMALQMRLNPPPPDPMQARIFALMPIVFTFLLAGFPAGLILYWTCNNILSILQQAVIMKRAGVEVRFHPPAFLSRLRGGGGGEEGGNAGESAGADGGGEEGRGGDEGKAGSDGPARGKSGKK